MAGRWRNGVEARLTVEMDEARPILAGVSWFLHDELGLWSKPAQGGEEAYAVLGVGTAVCA
jgi:hypothetical protein